MKLVLILGGTWIVGVIFYLSLFKAASRGDKLLEEAFDEYEYDKEKYS